MKVDLRRISSEKNIPYSDVLWQYVTEDFLWRIDKAGLAPVLEEYRPLCVSLGKDVRVNGVAARALEVEKNGALRVRYAETGEVRAVLAGDVSVRGMTDYI